MSSPTPLLARLTILPLVLLLIGVIAFGGFGLGRDTTVPTHSLRNAEACLSCHVSFEDYGLRQSLPGLCGGCHSLEGLSEREGHSGIGPATAPADSTCMTCHDVHGKTREGSLLWPEVAEG